MILFAEILNSSRDAWQERQMLTQNPCRNKVTNKQSWLSFILVLNFGKHMRYYWRWNTVLSFLVKDELFVSECLQRWQKCLKDSMTKLIAFEFPVEKTRIFRYNVIYCILGIFWGHNKCDFLHMLIWWHKQKCILGWLLPFWFGPVWIDSRLFFLSWYINPYFPGNCTLFFLFKGYSIFSLALFPNIFGLDLTLLAVVLLLLFSWTSLWLFNAFVLIPRFSFPFPNDTDVYFSKCLHDDCSEAIL